MQKPKREPIEYKSQNTPTIAYVLIAIGVIWLLARVLNFWTLWPLLLIGVGFLLITGRLQPGDVQTHHFTAPVNDTQSARVQINTSMGKTHVYALDDDSALIDADVTHIGEVDFNVHGDAEAVVELTTDSSSNWYWLNPANWFNAHRQLRWEVGLNRTLPTNLTIQGGIEESTLDLDGLNLTELTVKGGVGKIDLTLPATNAPYDATVHGGVGEVNVKIASGAVVNLSAKAGVGAFNIITPESTGIRVQAKMGVGDIKLPKHFERIEGHHSSGIGGSGVWETPGFDNAKRQVFIQFDGGVGELRVS